MRSRSRLRPWAAGLVLAASTVSGAAYAGYHYSAPVSFVTSTNVWGSLYSARYSSDATEFIGCETWAYAGKVPDAVCYAKASNGAYASCWTEDANLVAQARTLNQAGTLQFEFDAQGNCTYINVSTASNALP